MDMSNWNAIWEEVQDMGGDADAAGADWRTQLPEGSRSRQRSVNEIMYPLKRHLPFFGEDEILEHKKIAIRFEEKTYIAATSQSGYRRMIFLGILNAASYSQNPQYPGNANGGDWQEEIFQKIRSMNDMYFPELNEMYQKMAAKLQQHDSLPQQPRNEQLEKLRLFEVMLERLILFLRISKNEVQQNHKEKIIAVEKQIINILNSNWPRKPVSSMSQGQLSQSHLHTLQHPLQPRSQISQMHSNENHMNSQMHPVNVQGSTTASQQNNVTNSQNNSSSSVSGVSNSGQNMMDALQSGSTMSMDPGQGNALKMLTMEIIPQNPTASSIQFNAAGNTSQNTNDPVL